MRDPSNLRAGEAVRTQRGLHYFELLLALVVMASAEQWALRAEGTTRIEGLAIAGNATDLHDLGVEGALWVRGSIQALHRVTLQSPVAWPSVLPPALEAPLSLNRVQIDWR